MAPFPADELGHQLCHAWPGGPGEESAWDFWIPSWPALLHGLFLTLVLVACRAFESAAPLFGCRALW